MNFLTQASIPSWINEELASLDLSDERLTKRAKLMLSDQYAHPHQTLHGSARDEAASKGAWRFQNHKQGPSMSLYAVYAREIHPPEGIKPLDWMLLSTRKVSKAKHALTLMNWYACRWQIEVFFKILKTSCRVLDDQTHQAGHFQINLAFKFIVAWRIAYTTMLCREKPDESCQIAFEEAEWKALYCHHYKTHQCPEAPPTLQETTLMLARLGNIQECFIKNKELHKI